MRSCPPNSHCIVTLLVLRTTWWWPTYKAKTCSCILQSVAYYIVMLCFWLHVYVSIYIIHCVIDLTQRGLHILRSSLLVSVTDVCTFSALGQCSVYMYLSCEWIPPHQMLFIILCYLGSENIHWKALVVNTIAELREIYLHGLDMWHLFRASCVQLVSEVCWPTFCLELLV